MVKGRKRTGDPAIYLVAGDFRDRGMRSDDSVFTPGAPIWSSGNFQELQRDFVENLDETDRRFEEKLADQLRTTSDPARQLFTELFCFHLLISSVITPAKKRELIETVLALMDQPVDVPDSVVDVLGLGMVNPGTYFNTGRWAQLRYLIMLGVAWKKQPAQWRDQAIEDPWEFKAFAQALVQSGSKTQFRATLHLFFPETFEAIVSDRHVDRILDRFGDLARTEDADQCLQEIRAALTPRYGDEFDFYDERVRPLWEQGLNPWPELVRWAAKLRGSTDFDAAERDDKIEVGRSLAPVITAIRAGGAWQEQLLDVIGSSAHNLVRSRTTDALRSWMTAGGSLAQDTLDRALRVLWSEDQDKNGERVQTFCDAIEPAVDEPGQRTSLASYLLMGIDATAYPLYERTLFTKVFELLGRDPSSGLEGRRYERVLSFCAEMRSEAAERGLTLRDNLDVQSVISMLHGVQEDSELIASWPEKERRVFFAWRDGNTTAEPEEDVEAEPEPTRGAIDALVQQAASSCHVPVPYLQELEDLLDHKGQIVLYGPPGTGKTFIALELAYALVGGRRENITLVQFHPSTTYEDFFEGIRPLTGDDGGLRYDIVQGPLARMAASARASASEQFVMIIDELNRANLPKVLGELLFLFEYRDRAATTLYRPDDPFTLPQNLWFIATMNTVDRSVALIDAAMRRRFHFVPMYPDTAPISDVLPSICSDDEAWIPELVDRVNRLLVDDLGGRDHQIGPSHFITATRTVDGIAKVWRHSIEPLIEDQLFGQDERVDRYRWDNVVADHRDLIPDLEATGQGETLDKQSGAE